MINKGEKGVIFRSGRGVLYKNTPLNLSHDFSYGQSSALGHTTKLINKSLHDETLKKILAEKQDNKRRHYKALIRNTKIANQTL